MFGKCKKTSEVDEFGDERGDDVVGLSAPAFFRLMAATTASPYEETQAGAALSDDDEILS